MKIHTVRKGESPKSIAAQYEITEEYLRLSNELLNNECCVGEELLILQPTRTYRIARADTVERLAMRFGTKANDVYAKNPWIRDRGLKTGETVALKYPEKKLGGAVANGFFYKGCTRESLYRALPYLTYVTFSSAISDARGTKLTHDTAPLAKEVKSQGKTALLRVYDTTKEKYKKKNEHKRYSEELISCALSGGYDGISLNAFANGSYPEYIAFITELKRAMIGKNLILILEIGEASPKELCDMADGCVLSCADETIGSDESFEVGTKKKIANFAKREHRIKSFIELPCFSLVENEYVSINDALNVARCSGCELKENERALTLEFEDKDNRKRALPSLKNTKAILDMVHEYDFMGICFDIMRTPLNRIMMYDAQFSTVYPTTVRSREGCSRGF